MITVYPRWRGEHFLCPELHLLFRGLSPLARGTHIAIRTNRFRRRFIPAGAGNTGSRSLTKLSATVYPRWRGEHSHLPCSRWSRSGLSPLARGTLILFSSHRYRRRFIPAGAGNTLVCVFVAVNNTVYPRWRGEHDVTPDPARTALGLSPLARGTH